MKALIDVQKSFNQKTHLQQTMSKLKKVKEKYNLESSDELSEEERDSQKIVAEEAELSISELSESGLYIDIGKAFYVACFLFSQHLTKGMLFSLNLKNYLK